MQERLVPQLHYRYFGDLHGCYRMVVGFTYAVVNLNPLWRGVLDRTLCDKVCQ